MARQRGTLSRHNSDQHPGETLASAVARHTNGWGVDVVFEASGSAKAYKDIFSIVGPGGAVVLIGLPVETAAFDVPGAIAREVRIETVFR
jgi:D-xylulose reductase